jgi:hypothetical protein
MGCLFGGGTSWLLGAQTVHVSVWSAELDHSLESVLVFLPQSREEAEASIRVYDDILAQQVTHIDITGPSGASTVGRTIEAPPSMDQEADTLIVNPLKTGAEFISSPSWLNIDFVLISQLSMAVKPGAYRIASGVDRSGDIESLAFLNPDGTHVLFTVNHSKSPVSLEAFWRDRLFTYTQAGNSIALFVWDPKNLLVSLFPQMPGLSAKGSLSIEAKCSNVSPLGIDLRCESQAFSCSIFPIRFNCSSQRDSVTLSVTLWPTDKNDANGIEPGSVNITAAPDVGEPTTLHIPCCSAER